MRSNKHFQHDTLSGLERISRKQQGPKGAGAAPSPFQIFFSRYLLGIACHFHPQSIDTPK
jgi:hypothetical protein